MTDLETLARLLYLTSAVMDPSEDAPVTGKAERRRAWSDDLPWDTDPDRTLCEHERDDYRAQARLLLEALKPAGLLTPEPPPQPSEGPAVWPMVISETRARAKEMDRAGHWRWASFADALVGEMEKRDRLGRERYGVPLQPFNGRRPTVDMLEELCDAMAYGQQAEIEAQTEEERRELPAIRETLRDCAVRLLMTGAPYRLALKR